MLDVTPLVGLRIRLQRTIDVPCGACGEAVVVISHGVGPHAAALHCATCDRQRGSLPKAITEFLLVAINRFGWPPEAITIRNSEFAQANETASMGADAAEEASTR
ncbi:hypothetical protein FXV83_15160 [Bradyrhizobium hipponense]|uniref:Uncharacterized protein n=1 Tax=Bradyrhizobium hipponense TaxID=2605638 RepID=A0A5S4YP01_9BRAD|nr:hypothetical protein [Bradyrhizobium hipponense]TYO65753.1 hypothetical protein FXV83_15160 [Bradyrhizobium hipponense]